MKANAAASENRELGKEIACANSVRMVNGSRTNAVHPKRRGFTSNAAPASWIATKTQRSDPDVSRGSVDTKSQIKSNAVCGEYDSDCNSRNQLCGIPECSQRPDRLRQRTIVMRDYHCQC